MKARDALCYRIWHSAIAKKDNIMAQHIWMRIEGPPKKKDDDDAINEKISEWVDVMESLKRVKEAEEQATEEAEPDG